MSEKFPELVFVSGPQTGERAMLTASPALIGRTPQCDICCKEEFVSRQHVRMEMAQGGLVVENLSANGTLINSKRYKAGLKVLLATGDVLGVGLATQILYVAAGDDAEEALAEYRRKAPPPEPPPVVEKPAPDKAPAAVGADGNPKTASLAGAVGRGVPSATAPPVTNALAPPPPGGRAPVAPAASPLTADKKLRKYLKFIVVYAVGLVALVVFLIMFRNHGGETQNQNYVLTRDDISKALRQKLRREVKPTEAQAALAAAEKLFDRRNAAPSNLYEVVHNYNVYLARKEGNSVWEDPEQNRRYDQALDELVDAVSTRYDNAYAHERNKNFVTAKKIYEELLRMLPMGEQGTPVGDVVKNIMQHLDNVSKKTGK